jgi:hypothetical protein
MQPSSSPPRAGPCPVHSLSLPVIFRPTMSSAYPSPSLRRLVLLAIVVVQAGAFAPPSTHTRRPAAPVVVVVVASAFPSSSSGGIDDRDVAESHRRPPTTAGDWIDADLVVAPSSSRRAALASMTRSAATATAAAIVASRPAHAIDTYLTEPTEEFKESERQRMEFRKVQLGLKADFVAVLARLTSVSSTESELIADLVELRELVIKTGGLPLGIKKEDMYKVIRSKKAKGYWPTNVEIA